MNCCTKFGANPSTWYYCENGWSKQKLFVFFDEWWFA